MSSAYSVVPHDTTPESCWVRVSFLQWEGVTCLRQNGGEGDSDTSYFRSIWSPRPCLYSMAPPCSPWSLSPLRVGLCPSRLTVLLVMLQGGQAGIRVSSACCGRRPRSREGGSWVPEPQASPGLQPMDPADMWAVEAKCSNPQL